MNPSDPLAQLHPLREPAAIGWWPLAPGWWALLAILLLACAVAAWFWLRRYRANAYRRQGLAALAAIEARWQTERDTQKTFTAANALLQTG